MTDITCTKCGMVFKSGVSYGYACGYGNACGLYASMTSDILPVLKTFPTPAPTLRDAPMSDAAVEAVARAFCKRMGLDPDEGGCLLPGNSSFDVAYYGPRWQQVAQDAREAIAMSLALKEVLG